MLIIGVGSIIRHRKFHCIVLRFTRKGVVVKRQSSGLVLTIPYHQMPLSAIS
jgi:hypothetical protein